MDGVRTIARGAGHGRNVLNCVPAPEDAYVVAPCVVEVGAGVAEVVHVVKFRPRATRKVQVVDNTGAPRCGIEVIICCWLGALPAEPLTSEVATSWKRTSAVMAMWGRGAWWPLDATLSDSSGMMDLLDYQETLTGPCIAIVRGGGAPTLVCDWSPREDNVIRLVVDK